VYEDRVWVGAGFMKGDERKRNTMRYNYEEAGVTMMEILEVGGREVAGPFRFR